MTRPPYRDFATKVVHAGEPETRYHDAVTLPIFQSSTYLYEGGASYDNIKYIRLNNSPNHNALHEKLAQLENTEAGLVASSGMAAISTALLTFLKAGDHILTQSCLYGGTIDFIAKDLSAFGITYDSIDANAPETWREKLKPNTRIIYVESIANPLMEVADLEAIVAFAKEHGLLSMIDNTFTSPYNFRPIEWGFDLSLHSCSKYLNGHSDLVAGAVVGREELVSKVKHKLNHFGGTLDPHACFLLHRGIKTLAVRMQRHNENAQRIAQFLHAHPAIAKVHYPGLDDHPHYARTHKLFQGCGGMLSFELKGGLPHAHTLMRSCQIPLAAVSLGGVETLFSLPAQASHAGLTPEERQHIGISDSLVRMSVGIESADELLDDIGQVLSQFI